MRRILAVLFCAISAVVLACVMFLWGMTSVSTLTQDGTTEISLLAKADVLGDTYVRDWVEPIPERFGVEVSRVVYSDSGTVDVYASDMTLGGRISLTDGALPPPDQDSDAFVSNADTGSELQVGSFELFAPGTQVLVHPFDALDHRDGYLGYLRLYTTDGAAVDEIADYLTEHVGLASRDTGASTDAASSILYWLVSNALTAGMLLLLVVLAVFTLVRYGIRESRNVAILELHGWGKLRVALGHYARGLLPCAGASFGLCAVGLVVAACALGAPFVLSEMLALDLALAAGLLVLGVLVLGFTTALQNAFYSKVRIIGGKKPFAAVAALQFVLKYAVLAVLLAGAAQMGGQLDYLRQQDAANDVWRRAENVYHVVTKDAGQIAAEQGGDYEANRAYIYQAFDTYRALNDEYGLMLCYAGNYQDMGMPGSGGTKLWQVNTGPDSYNKESPWASTSGTCLVVNENYLRANPAADVKGADVLDGLVRDDTTINLLVPEGLRAHEDEIRAGFRKDFWFWKVDVAEIYEERIGEPAPDLSEDDLAVNIVWIPDGLSWFVYDASIMPETGNEVTDAVLVVDEGNIDPSYYYAWMTSSCYYAADPANPTGPLTEAAARFDATDMYNTVQSVFDQRANAVLMVRNSLRFTVAAEVLLAAGALLCIYLFCTCWYVQRRRAIVVKRLHGFGMVRIVGPMLAVNVGLTALLALTWLGGGAWPGDIPLALRVALPACDLLVTLACCALVQRAVVARALKGEE